MTEMLQRAIAAIEKLPTDEQDAIAARILVDLEDEHGWTDRFGATTDEQWDALASEVRREIAAGETTPLNEVFGPAASKP